MIKIKADTKKSQIVIQGHSGYEEQGKDIVCASVSSIAITSVNAMLRFSKDSVTWKQEDGYLQIIVEEKSKETLVLFENMLELFQELEQQYKEYVTVEKI